MVNIFLFHYYEKGRRPFLNLSDLTVEEAIQLHTKLASEDGSSPCFAKRYGNGTYMLHRRIVEERAYSMFIRKGGKPQRKNPHYMVLDTQAWEECEWFIDFGVVKIPIDDFKKIQFHLLMAILSPRLNLFLKKNPNMICICMMKF